MNIVISSYAVRNVDGSVDHEATLEKFASDLFRFEELHDREQQVIGGAINAVFDEYQGARLNTPFLVGQVLKKLNAQPENYKALSDRVVTFIRSNSQAEDSVFVISKGKGGGIGRRSDVK